MTKRLLSVLVAVAVLLAAPSASSASARGGRQAGCAVPELSGVTLKTARLRLARAHCEVGAIHRPTAHGTLLVDRQTPKAHARMKHGTKVTLWVKVKPAKKVTTTTASVAPTTSAPTVSSPAVSTPAPTTSTPAPTTTTTTTPPTVRAIIDPSYTQDQSNPLMVTWTYDAGVDDGTLPDGTLSLTVYEHGQVASAGGCTIDVGGTITGGNCTQTLPQYGSYDVTVTYNSSSASVAPSTETDTEDIEAPTPPPPPPPVATTVTLSLVSEVNQTGYTGPNHFGYYNNYLATLDAESTNPDSPTYAVTLTDTTTGVSVPGSLSETVWTDIFNALGNTIPAGDVYVDGLGDVADTDVIDVSVSTGATSGYLASPASIGVQIWPSAS
jgi:hypothetical protein